jgi:hypothetical protein
VSEIALESEHLRLVVDPGRGAEIRSLVATRRAGTELLFQAPWQPAPLPGGPLDEDAWTASWRGGWQVLFPNAGMPCDVGGRRHGFHGAASVAAWHLVRRGGGVVVCRWHDAGGLGLEREVRLAGPRVEVQTTVSCASPDPQPFLLVEHLLLGGPLAGEDAQLRLPGGRLTPQTWEGKPLASDGSWPFAGVGDNPEDWSRLAPAPLSRFGVVTELPTSEAVVTSPGAGVGVFLSWALDALPCLWLWQERLGSAVPPWDGRTECLAVEPASTSAADGLAAALERGEARLLGPGERYRAWIALELVDPAGSP